MSDHSEVIDVSESVAVALRPTDSERKQAVSLFGTDDPGQTLERAGAVAAMLKDVVRKQGLISNIKGKEYPRCEAWTLLGTMLGVFPVCAWTKQVEGGWEARVEAKTKDGSVVGAAEAQCLRSERNWADRDDFALRSMAQTRATAKALRMPLGFVMTLAGYESTPSEEMPTEPAPAPAAPRPKATTKDVLPKEATPDQVARFMKALEPVAAHAAVYFHRKGWLPAIPSEDNAVLSKLPLRHVPKTKREFDSIMAEIQAFVDGDGKMPDEWFMKVVVPIPHKGQKRDEYMKDPDTIGSLYDGMKAGDAEKGRRLWGFVNHFEPKGWVKNDGTKMSASESDFRFREALDAFNEAHGDHGEPEREFDREHD